MRLRRIAEAARSSLFVIPAVMVLVSLVLSVLTQTFDVRTGVGRLLFPGDFHSARSLLTAVATGSITLMGLVFSITMLVVELTSSQYSPRALRTFLRDRNSHITLGTFAATFAFALASLRAVSAQQVPGTAVSLAVFLAFVNLGVFVQYISHMARKIRVSSIVSAVAEETDKAIAAFLSRREDAGADREGEPAPAKRGVAARSHAAQRGYVVAVDRNELLAQAVELDVTIDLLVATGDFVPAGAPLLEVVGASPPEVDAFAAAVTLEGERSLDQDPRYGFRQLVDIAERAVSPSLNDPTTASTVIDVLHDLLAQLVAEPFPSGRVLDPDGTVRVRLVEPVWGDFLDLSVDELLLHGDQYLQVLRGLQRMLLSLQERATPERVAPIAEKLVLVRERLARVESALEATAAPLPRAAYPGGP